MDKSAKIPAHYQDIYNTITGLTDTFWDAYLNDEYKHLCRKMASVLCQHRFPLTKGNPEGWACSIVDEVGWLLYYFTTVLLFCCSPVTKTYDGDQKDSVEDGYVLMRWL